MTERQLFVLVTELVIIVTAARFGGWAAIKIGVPEVIGELVAGICLGPSLLGALWPEGFARLFPSEPLNHSLLELVSWIGVLMLVLLAGLEMRLRVLKQSGRAVLFGWAGGFGIPFVAGYLFGIVLPAELIGAGIPRPLFALFVAVAMSISAVPVVARILMDLNLFQTRLGMLIVSSALWDDAVGWMVLPVVVSLATRGAVDVSSVLLTLVGTGLFLVAAFTVGQWFVRRGVHRTRESGLPHAQMSFILLIVFAAGALTQALHVHLVLGAFVGAILVARSSGKEGASLDALRQVAMAFFVPFFFGHVGLKADLTTIRGSAIPFALAAVGLACSSKVLGGYLGARAGGLPRWESLAVGCGRNARGAMELVIAAFGLSLGIVTLPMYSIIVMIAVITTLMTAPLVGLCAGRIDDLELAPRRRLNVEAA